MKRIVVLNRGGDAPGTDAATPLLEFVARRNLLDAQLLELAQVPIR